MILPLSRNHRILQAVILMRKYALSAAQAAKG